MNKRSIAEQLRSAYLPGSEVYEELLAGCTRPEIKNKFKALAKLNPRALRAEIGSAARLVNSSIGSTAFEAWSRGGFNLGQFL